MVTESPIIAELLPIKPQASFILNHDLMKGTERALLLLSSSFIPPGPFILEERLWEEMVM